LHVYVWDFLVIWQSWREWRSTISGVGD